MSNIHQPAVFFWVFITLHIKFPSVFHGPCHLPNRSRTPAKGGLLYTIDHTLIKCKFKSDAQLNSGWLRGGMLGRMNGSRFTSNPWMNRIIRVPKPPTPFTDGGCFHPFVTLLSAAIQLLTLLSFECDLIIFCLHSLCYSPCAH